MKRKFICSFLERQNKKQKYLIIFCLNKPKINFILYSNNRLSFVYFFILLHLLIKNLIFVLYLNLFLLLFKCFLGTQLLIINLAQK